MFRHSLGNGLVQGQQEDSCFVEDQQGQQPMYYPEQAYNGMVYYPEQGQQPMYYPEQAYNGMVYYPGQAQNGMVYYPEQGQQGGYYPGQGQQPYYQGQQGGYYPEQGQQPYYQGQQGGYYPGQAQTVPLQRNIGLQGSNKNDSKEKKKGKKNKKKLTKDLSGVCNVQEITNDSVLKEKEELDETKINKPVAKSWRDVASSAILNKKIKKPAVKSKFEAFYYTGISSIEKKVFGFLDGAKSSIRVQVDQLRPVFAEKLASIKAKESSINISILTNIYDPCSNMCKKYEINKKCNVCKISHDFKRAVQILIECGVNVMFQNNNDIHDKFIIVDNRFTLIGSCNYTYAGLNFNRESGVIINDTEVADRYLDYWFACRYLDGCTYAAAVEYHKKSQGLLLKTKDSFPNEDHHLSCLEKMNAVSDDIRENGMDICFSCNRNISDFICEAISNAKLSINIQVFNFTSPLISRAIYDALIENKGLQVTIRTGSSFDVIKRDIQGFEREDADIFEETSDANLNWRKKQEQPQSCITRINFEEVADLYSDDGRAWCVHDKLIVIDDEVVLTGSANFTEGTDNSEKLENMIKIKDVRLAEKMLGYMSNK